MDTSKHISLAHAFAHCASTGSYWLWIFIIVLASVVGIIVLTKANNKSEVNPIVKNIVYFLIAVAIAGAVFIRPCTIAQNTSEEMAARGHYIGY